MLGFCRSFALVLALGTALPVSTAFAQASQPVELSGDVMIERIVTEAGEDRRVLEKPDTVLPGDMLIFSTNYRNTGAEIVKDFVVTIPVPQAVRIGSQDAQSLEVSVDGGSVWGKLAGLQVTDGQGSLRPATVDDVTHIRWVLASLEPGAKGTVTYRGTVR